ncbi:MAG: GntR family transcriptional regulator [Clostridium sp.]
MENPEDSLLGGGYIHTNTYKEQAYKLIKDAVLYNRFRVGAVYSQEAICNELGISRTPVREALLELQNEGYVSFSRGKGVKVVPVTEKDAKDILEMRLFLEKNNAYLAASRATDEDLNQIVSCFDELNSKLSLLDSRLLYRIDHTFHRAIALATHNDWMTRETELILDNYLRFETKSVYNNSIDAQVVLDEHLAIRNAIIDRNPDKAEQMMNSHLNKSYSRTLSQFWNAPAK